MMVQRSIKSVQAAILDLIFCRRKFCLIYRNGRCSRTDLVANFLYVFPNLRMDSIAKVYRRNTLKVDIPSIENFIIKIVHLLSRINDSPLFFIFPIFTLYQEQRKNVIQRLIARILVVIVNICIKNRKTLSQRYDIPYRLPLIAIFDRDQMTYRIK